MYCAWLADQTDLMFTLPTEAQWEYAARSRGQNVPYATDTGEEDNDTYLQRPKEYIDPSIPPSGNMLSHSSGYGTPTSWELPTEPPWSLRHDRKCSGMDSGLVSERLLQACSS